MQHRMYTLTAVLIALSLVVLAMPTVAETISGIRFCSGDPIFDVAGQEVNVVVGLAPYEIKYQISKSNPVFVELSAPKETHPKVIYVGGEFEEIAKARKHEERKVRVDVNVPQVEGLQAVSLTVYVNGQLRRQVEVYGFKAQVEFPW